MNDLMEIDGSVLEGGGQILRMALGFSVLCRTPVRIRKIRMGRSKPGLATQHIKGIELLRDICQARTRNVHLGSTEIEFCPGDISYGKFCGHIQTAGSISLLLQATLPVAIFAPGPITLDLRGGTNADMAPQVDFLTEIFRPNMERFGATFDFDLLRRGYFPKGGGHCVVNVKPVQTLKAVDLTEFGNVSRFFGWSFVAGSLPLKVARDFANGAKNVLRRVDRCNIDVEEYKETPDVAPDNCAGIILGCTTDVGVVLGGSALGNRNKDSFRSGEEAAEEIRSAIEARACVDRHVQDMLIILMALADGRSRIRTEALTMHTRTAIYIVELMTKVKFNVIEQGNNAAIIECNGLGLRNRNCQTQ